MNLLIFMAKSLITVHAWTFGDVLRQLVIASGPDQLNTKGAPGQTDLSGTKACSSLSSTLCCFQPADVVCRMGYPGATGEPV